MDILVAHTRVRIFQPPVTPQFSNLTLTSSSSLHNDLDFPLRFGILA
jgi:hypothetical protein